MSLSIELSLLKNVVLFRGLPAGQLEKIAERIGVRSVKPGTRLLARGDRSQHCYFILDGQVRISREGQAGSDYTLAVLQAGDVFSEMALVGQSSCSADAVVETECLLGSFEKVVFDELVASDPALGCALLAAVLQLLSVRVRDSNEKTVRLLQLDKYALMEELMQVFTGIQAASSPVDYTSLRRQIDEAVSTSLSPEVGGEPRRVTVLISDLRGFTAMSERYKPTEMVQSLNRYLDRMTQIIIDYGGTIDKFMGDAIMVLFGAPRPLENDVHAALACAVEMQMAMSEVNRENDALGMEHLYMGIGINTGTVVAGRLGSPLHNEYTVIGDEVNLTSRIEAQSLRGQILISENVSRIARDYIETGDVNEVTVKGKQKKIRMHELLGVNRPQILRVPLRETRRSQRVPVEIDTQFQIIDGSVVLPEIHQARALDLSYGGMKFATTQRLDTYDEIKFTLQLFLLLSSASDIYAKIRRVVASDWGYTCHVEFTAMEETIQKAIKEQVDRIVQSKSY
jgi:adenylate cyclase